MVQLMSNMFPPPLKSNVAMKRVGCLKTNAPHVSSICLAAKPWHFAPADG